MIRSYLAKYQAKSIDAEKIKQEAWQHQGHLVLMAEQIARLTADERRALEQIATRHYGNKVLKG